MEKLSSHFQGIPGGVVMSLIAFSIVFISLTGLCLMIYGVKYIAAAVDASAKAKGNAKAAKADAPKGTQVVHTVAATAPAAAVTAGEDENLLAVIGAVLASTLGGGFAVKSVRPLVLPSRLGGIWKGASRIESLEGF